MSSKLHQLVLTVHSVVAPPGELRENAGVVWLAGNTVWSTPERIRGEVLTTMRYTNRRLRFTFTFTLWLRQYIQPAYAHQCSGAVVWRDKFWQDCSQRLWRFVGNYWFDAALCPTTHQAMHAMCTCLLYYFYLFMRMRFRPSVFQPVSQHTGRTTVGCNPVGRTFLSQRLCMYISSCSSNTCWHSSRRLVGYAAHFSLMKAVSKSLGD